MYVHLCDVLALGVEEHPAVRHHEQVSLVAEKSEARGRVPVGGAGQDLACLVRDDEQVSA